MKKILLITTFFVITTAIIAQSKETEQQRKTDDLTYTTNESVYQSQVSLPKKAVINAGVLMGGGSLIGADFEYMPGGRFGIQGGMGISSYGFGVNYHLKNRINSSFISFQYWNQGFGDNHYATYLGPMFVFRAKKIFQAGIGLGAILKKGPAYSMETDVNAALLYNIGVYFPL